MERHYVVYDMTSFDERGENYLQVGIAIKNEDNQAIAQKYDACSEFYEGTKSADASRINDGFRAPAQGSCYRYDDLNPDLADPHPELPKVIKMDSSAAERAAAERDAADREEQEKAERERQEKLNKEAEERAVKEAEDKAERDRIAAE